jgi:hypothetical protein
MGGGAISADTLSGPARLRRESPEAIHDAFRAICTQPVDDWVPDKYVGVLRVDAGSKRSFKMLRKNTAPLA